MNERLLKLILIIIALVGVCTSAYLEYVSSQPACPVAFEGCDRVIVSPYSRIYGISLSSLGLTWFLTLLLLTIIASFKDGRGIRYILLGWSLISLPSVAVLVWIEIAVLRAICVYCTVAHILGIISIIPAYRLTKRIESRR